MKRIIVGICVLLFGVSAYCQGRALGSLNPPAQAYCFNAVSGWIKMAGAASGTALGYSSNPTPLFANNAGTWYPVACDSSGNITPGGTAGGDLSGTYPNPTVVFVNGNTMPLAAGFTSGGIPYFSSTTEEDSSALLTNHAVVIGGGAGAAPRTIAACGTNFPIVGATLADPGCSTIGWLSSATQWGIPYVSTVTQMSTTAALTANALIKAGSSAAPAASSVVDDGKNITSAEVFVGGNKSFVTSDFTDSTSTTLQLVTGLSFTLPTSKAVNVSFHCSLLFDQGTAAVSDSIGIGVTGTAPTQANASAVVFPSTSTLTAGTLAALASTTPTAVVTFTPSAITTIWRAEVDGTIEQPSNATPGVFGVYVATTTGSDNFIVKRGSYCTLF